MNKYTKITLEELMARKEQMLEARKQPKRKELYIKSLDGTIVIEEPSRDIAVDAQAMDNGLGDIYMVYQSVVEPPLKSSELQKAYGCIEPMDIVEKIFDPGEIPQIAVESIKLAGYAEGTVKAVDEVKN